LVSNGNAAGPIFYVGQKKVGFCLLTCFADMV
jgi:hypothetical protein